MRFANDRDAAHHAAWLPEGPPPHRLGTATAKDRVVERLDGAAPVPRWLAEHVGDSELPDDRRR